MCKNLLKTFPVLADVLSNAVAVRFVEIAIQYSRADRSASKTLGFTISDRNTSSLLSLDDPFERTFGHRLLRGWKILVDGRAPTQSDFYIVLPATLELWDSGVDQVTGSWLAERHIDVAVPIDLGFLVPMASFTEPTPAGG